MTDPSYLESVKSELSRIRNKLKTAIYVFGCDFNLPDIYWTDHTVTDSQYPHRVSKTFLDIAKDLNLEQVVNFPTSLQNTLDLVFMSHPSFKISYKPLPPIGLKSDHDMVLLDTSILPVRNRLPRRRIYIWKKATVDGIRSHFQAFADRFCTTSAQSVEDIWTPFKSAKSSAVCINWGIVLTGNALIRRGVSCLLNVGRDVLGRVVLGRVVFGASCPVSHKTCFIV